jgi:hypothetical protein
MALTALGICLVATDAEAQRRGRGNARKIDGVRFDVHLDIGWHEALGAGLRVEFAIVPDGFLRGGRVQDELALSMGGEAFFWSFHDRHHFDDDRHNDGLRYHDGFSLMPVFAAQWNFYLNESWSVFPEVGAALAWWTYEHHHNGNTHGHSYVRFYPLISVGARWHFTDRNALLFRLTWPVGFQFGITF